MTEKILNVIAAIIIAVVIGAAVGAGYAVWRMFEAIRDAIDVVFGDDFYLYAGLFSIAMMVVVAVGATLSLVRYMVSRSGRVYARDGIYPLVPRGQELSNHNEPGAQTLAAVAGVGRLNSTTARKVIEAHYRPVDQYPANNVPLQNLQQPQVIPLTARDIVQRVDPQISPHYLLVGSTGSGKTSATYSILDQLAKRFPCEFLITEPGGVNWGSQAIATQPNEIASVILSTNEEMERRQELLRAEDVAHITQLRNVLPYCVLLIEEIDAVLDIMRINNPVLRKQMLIALRNIARMGRKAGVCLVAVSQSGTTDVFDSHVRKNFGNVFIFRSEQTVAEMFRLGGVRVSSFGPGEAYSTVHGTTVQFENVARPQLLSSGNVPPQYQNTDVPPYRGDGICDIPPVSADVPQFSTDQSTAYTPEQEAYIRRLYQQLGSLKAVQRHIYGESSEGGWWFYQIRYVVFGTPPPS